MTAPACFCGRAGDAPYGICPGNPEAPGGKHRDYHLWRAAPHLVTPEDVTEEFVERFYDHAIEGWYEDEPIDWEDALDRFESDEIDFGDSMLSPAIRKLQRMVRAIRRENGLS